MSDVLVVGHLTRDVIIVDGCPRRTRVGGVPYYAALVYRSLGHDTAVLTRLREDDHGLLADLYDSGVHVRALPSRETTEFENNYAADDPDQRHQWVRSVADPFRPDDLAEAVARVIHLGPLTRADMGIDVLAAAAATGATVVLDAQGLVRSGDGGAVSSVAWPEAAEGLGCVDILQADAEETRLLAGEADLARATARLARMGPKEVLTTMGSQGARLQCGRRSASIPAYPPTEFVDSTGAGDTHLAGYVACRLRSGDASGCARFAAAVASLKLESAGPFRSGERAARERLDENRAAGRAAETKDRAIDLVPLGQRAPADGLR